MDLAASVQVVTEEIVLRMARHVHRETGMRNLCLAGGVALNCVANGRLLREGPFERLWIQPAAGDAGGALGVALAIHHKVLGAPRRAPAEGDGMRGSYLGPGFDDAAIEAALLAARRGVRTAVRATSCSTAPPACWPTSRSSAGSRAAWSSARARSARAASSAIRARRACSR